MREKPEPAQCTGYRVDTHEGRVGSVAAVLPRAQGDRPGVLLVQTDPLSCRLSAVPFRRVETVDSKRRRILLREISDARRDGVPVGARCRIDSGAK